MRNLFYLLTFIIATAMVGCVQPVNGDEPLWNISGTSSAPLQTGPIPTAVPLTQQAIVAEVDTGPRLTPTPDRPHPIPPLRTEAKQYVVQTGDTLGIIAQRNNVSVEAIVAENNLLNPNILDVGQILLIPAPEPTGLAPSFKIIPDAELVNSPSVVDFDISGYIDSKSGYLAKYLEEVNGSFMTGAQIVERVAQNYSVNPRILLTVLEHQSRWVTNANPAEETLEYPIGIYDPYRVGLYRQLAWVADNLNRGYYLWRVNGVSSWVLFDGNVVPVNPTINAGTAGLQYLYALLLGYEQWNNAITANGVQETYIRLFDYPFFYSYDPLIPPALTQPTLQLPFEKGEAWSFTGGPHGGWDNGSAWAALDFAPPSDALGCVQSDEWVVAVADGLIVRVGEGAVIQDLDMDGLEQTGWTVLYMHIETRDRIREGARVKAGDRIGHPSCEGGISTGTHLHLARRYNGEWIPADQSTIPFVMDSWTSVGTGSLYDGFLIREDGRQIEALNGREEFNQIQR